MKCSRSNDLEISEEIVSKYDFQNVEDKIKFLLKEKDGFAPTFSNEFFKFMGGETKGNKVSKVMYKKIDNFIELELNSEKL